MTDYQKAEAFLRAEIDAGKRYIGAMSRCRREIPSVSLDQLKPIWWVQSALSKKAKKA